MIWLTAEVTVSNEMTKITKDNITQVCQNVQVQKPS